MVFFVLAFVLILAVCAVLIYKHGFAKAWGVITTLFVAIAAAFAAFWDQIVTTPLPPV